MIFMEDVEVHVGRRFLLHLLRHIVSFESLLHLQEDESQGGGCYMILFSKGEKEMLVTRPVTKMAAQR